MPQLDPNSFIYQYFGILSILVVSYILLTYVALPILLRIILVRKYFSARLQNNSNNFMSTASLTTAYIKDNAAALIVSYKFSNFLNLALSNILTTAYSLSSILNRKNYNLVDNNLNLISLNIYTTTYISLLLILDDDNTTLEN